MIGIHTFSLFLAFALISEQGVESSRHYRQLTNGEIETLLSGHWIIEADDRPDYMKTEEHFTPSGHYVRYDDNYEAEGVYSFRDGEVCTRVELRPERCRRVFVDKDGRYWIAGPRFLTKIQIGRL